MGGSLSCYYCGESISEQDVFDDPLNFECPHCGASH